MDLLNPELFHIHAKITADNITIYYNVLLVYYKHLFILPDVTYFTGSFPGSSEDYNIFKDDSAKASQLFFLYWFC